MPPHLVEVRERVRDIGCYNEPLRRAESHRALRVTKERCKAPAAHVLVHEAGRLLTKQTSRKTQVASGETRACVF